MVIINGKFFTNEEIQRARTLVIRRSEVLASPRILDLIRRLKQQERLRRINEIISRSSRRRNITFKPKISVPKRKIKKPKKRRKK